MTRAAVEKQLDTAIDDARIALIHGLPRVGRSLLVKDWARKRDDVIFLSPEAFTPAAGPIVVIDHLDYENASKVVANIRSADEAKLALRAVLVPSDLRTFNALKIALVGFVETVEVVPLQITEYLAAQMPLAEAMGPVSSSAPQPTPTNKAAPNLDIHWLCGGLPQSITFDTMKRSLEWRLSIIDGLLSRDYNDFRVSTASRLPELLRWIANQNGGEFNEESCQILKKPELRSAIFVLESIGLIRRLSNYPVGSNLSMSGMPKLYLRDSGLLHALLGIESPSQLRSHKDAGDSWEGYAAEAIIDACGAYAASQFYRAQGPAGVDEIDLVLDFSPRGGPVLAIEFKLNQNEGPRPGYARASTVVGATEGFVVHSGEVSRTDTEVHRLTLVSAVQRIYQLCATLQ